MRHPTDPSHSVAQTPKDAGRLSPVCLALFGHHKTMKKENNSTLCSWGQYLQLFLLMTLQYSQECPPPSLPEWGLLQGHSGSPTTHKCSVSHRNVALPPSSDPPRPLLTRLRLYLPPDPGAQVGLEPFSLAPPPLKRCF